MGKIINLTFPVEKEEKLQKIANSLKELKYAFAEVVDEYEEEEDDDDQLNLLGEALDALEDAYSIIYDVIVDGMLEDGENDDDFDD